MPSWISKKIDLGVERKIVTAMIVSAHFLQEVVKLYKPSYMKSQFSRVVCGWCIDFFLKYKDAPQHHIQDIYESHRKSKSIDQETAQLVAEFLTDLSKTYEGGTEKFNHKYVLDQTVEYFRGRAIDSLIEEMQTLRDAGELTLAEARITEYKKVVQEVSSGCDPLMDKDLIISALETDDDEENNGDFLFQLGGDFGKLVGPFYRDDFIAIAGPMKRGKTWFFQYLAIQAMLAGLNTAYFSMGDMTIKQMVKRIHRMLSALPIKAGIYDFPVFDCLKNQQGVCELPQRVGAGKLFSGKEKPDYDSTITWAPCDVCRGTKNYRISTWMNSVELKQQLTWQKALKKGAALNKMMQGKLRLEAWPRKSAGMADIEATLQLWEHFEGFIPDVIITDYADIMRDESREQEYRHKLNWLWEAHDSMAKRRHCLVVTGTQTTRSTLSGKDIGPDEIAEDIRKMAHVSLLLGLNQTAKEKRDKVMRISKLASRHDEFDFERGCLLLQQLDCGLFHIDSLLL